MRPAAAIAAIAAACCAQAQPDSTWVDYRTGMLHEGVYFDFQAFRHNAPSVPLALLRDKDGLPVRDIRTAVSRLHWQTPEGERKPIRRDAIWGFCQRGAVYVAAGNGYYQLGILGSLTHMLYEMNYRDWDPYMYPYGGITRTILLQQVLDMDRGQFLPFNASGMDRALAHDSVLLEEFRALPRRQRNDPGTLFRFLRLYNERHPLRFPR